MNYKRRIILLLVLTFVTYVLEVDHADFGCHHQKQIRGSAKDLFEFLLHSHALEKLLPWLKRFKEADKRIIATGKLYTAAITVPISGEHQVYAVLTDFKPPKFITLDFSGDKVRQRIIIQLHEYHDRVLLRVSVYFRRNSLAFQYTLGHALRVYVKSQLEKSMANTARIFESLGGSNKILDFSRRSARQSKLLH